MLLLIGFAAILAVAATPVGAQQAPSTGFKIPPDAFNILSNQLEIHRTLMSNIPPGVGSPATNVCRTNLVRFNWRDHGRVTEARNQGTCGSCWSFATIGAIETSYRIFRPANSAAPDLSEQEVLDCATVFRTDLQADQPIYTCAGGWFEGPLRLAQNLGIAADNEYPVNPPRQYSAQQQACVLRDVPRIKINSWTPLPSVSPGTPIAKAEEIKQALCAFGGVVTAIRASDWPAALAAATSRIEGETSQSSPDPFAGWKVDHAVQVVGWDDSEKVWIIKNSWGKDWGDNGFAKIPYGTRNIGFMATAVQANVGSVLATLPQSQAANYLNIREQLNRISERAKDASPETIQNSLRDLKGRFNLKLN